MFRDKSGLDCPIGRVTLSTKQISIQWITVNALPSHIRWVPIYPLDGFIHSLYNYDWTPVFFFEKEFKV